MLRVSSYCDHHCQFQCQLSWKLRFEEFTRIYEYHSFTPHAAKTNLLIVANLGDPSCVTIIRSAVTLTSLRIIRRLYSVHYRLSSQIVPTRHSCTLICICMYYCVSITNPNFSKVLVYFGIS